MTTLMYKSYYNKMKYQNRTNLYILFASA